MAVELAQQEIELPSAAIGPRTAGSQPRQQRHPQSIAEPAVLAHPALITPKITRLSLADLLREFEGTSAQCLDYLALAARRGQRRNAVAKHTALR